MVGWCRRITPGSNRSQRNLTENIAAVQFDHRLLATLTVVASIATLVVGFATRPPRASRLRCWPSSAPHWCNTASAWQRSCWSCRSRWRRCTRRSPRCCSPPRSCCCTPAARLRSASGNDGDNRSGYESDACRAEGDAAAVVTWSMSTSGTRWPGSTQHSPHCGPDWPHSGRAATLLFANPRFGELFGLAPPHPPAGARFSTLLDQMATREEFAESEGARFIAAQREADRSCPSVARRIRADGQVIDIVSDPLPDGGWALTVTDISALARAEDDASGQAALMHSILEAIPHGVCVYGADRRVTMFNRAYTQVMTGAPLSIGDHLEEVIRRRAAAGEYGPGAVEEIFAQQMAFDVTRPQMRKRRRPNGTTLDVRTTPLPDGGYISVVTDITALTEAEAQVSRRADELAVMLANIRHGVMLWGPHGRLLASNAIAADLLELPPGLLTPGRTQGGTHRDLLTRGHFGQGDEAEAGLRALRAIDRSVPVGRQSISPAGRVLDIRSDPTPDGGWVSTLHRRDGGACRAGRAAPRQGGGGGGEPGQVALPRHHEPRAAHAAQRGDRLLRRAAARGGQPDARPGGRVRHPDQRGRPPIARTDQHHPRRGADRVGPLRPCLRPGRRRPPDAAMRAPGGRRRAGRRDHAHRGCARRSAPRSGRRSGGCSRR